MVKQCRRLSILFIMYGYIVTGPYDPIGSAVQETIHKAGANLADYRDPLKDAISQPTAKTAAVQPVTNAADIQKNPVAQAVDANVQKNMIQRAITPESALKDTISEVFSADPEFGIQHRRVEKLVARGIEFANKNSLGEICHIFSHTKDFIDGDLYLFVYDENGIALAHGQEPERIWKNLWEMRDRFGSLVVQDVINKCREGGGWISYEWRNSPKLTYVKSFIKNNKMYCIGCGYYPHSKRAFCMNATNGAVSLFNTMVNQENKPPIDAWGLLTYPTGRFVYGDIEMVVINSKGSVSVDSTQLSLVETNILEERDDNGRYIYKEIIAGMNEFKDLRQGRWFEFKSNKSKLLKFCQRVRHDATGEIYYITAGYFPGITEKEAVSFVLRGYAFMKSSGKSTASLEFTEKRLTGFESYYGYLHLIVYDFEGTCIAHGGNDKLIGLNAWNDVDQDGDYYIREMIQKAKELQKTKATTGAWISARLRNSFAAIYLMPINLGGKEDFVIATILYPSGKEGVMRLLAQIAAGFLKSKDVSLETAFNAFNLTYGQFVRGDLTVFAIDEAGLCYSWETTPRLIWKNLTEIVDDDGKYFVKEMIQRSTGGSATVRYKQNGRMKEAFMLPVDKGGKRFIVGSSYYTDEENKTKGGSSKGTASSGSAKKTTPVAKAPSPGIKKVGMTMAAAAA